MNGRPERGNAGLSLGFRQGRAWPGIRLQYTRVTEILLQRASDKLKQRRHRQAGPTIPKTLAELRKELDPSEDVSTSLVDKLKMPKYGWTLVDNYWCPNYKM